MWTFVWYHINMYVHENRNSKLIILSALKLSTSKKKIDYKSIDYWITLLHPIESFTWLNVHKNSTSGLSLIMDWYEHSSQLWQYRGSHSFSMTVDVAIIVFSPLLKLCSWGQTRSCNLLIILPNPQFPHNFPWLLRTFYAASSEDAYSFCYEAVLWLWTCCNSYGSTLYPPFNIPS